ncbi:branched-chain amino acid ABC transporter permease (plasmid) [Halorarum halophilum]|uniref:Branched-chain amino acid ABC transporter permease n=1 Tax=Halorarum halophilum TaxID=2743090 RepID=A0A7D5K3E6_9EURY|nr:branched-chain amino acid ABC transporter permease [Halobaculum halophilum]QLG29621.1 branched-chain amino acid ABC transporter permease [Halobaculum halophilum]
MPPTELILQILVNGLLLGGIYAVAALGLSLVFGIMDIVNLAHGHMLMIGAYVAILLFAEAGITPLVGMFVAIVLLFLLGMALQKVLLERVVGEGIEQPIIVLFGLALVLQSLGRIVLGSDARSTDIGIPGQGIELGPVLLSFPRTVTFVVAVVLIMGTWAFLQYTTTGQAIRATSQNRDAARYMGIDTDRVYVITLGIGTALAGAAGALLSMLFPITPFVGWSYLLKAFAVVVLGGVGSVAGTLVGGLLLGVSENLGTLYLGGGIRDIISFTIFLVVLIVRPQGLFGTGGGDEE